VTQSNLSNPSAVKTYEPFDEDAHIESVLNKAKNLEAENDVSGTAKLLSSCNKGEQELVEKILNPVLMDEVNNLKRLRREEHIARAKSKSERKAHSPIEIFEEIELSQQCLHIGNFEGMLSSSKCAVERYPDNAYARKGYAMALALNNNFKLAAMNFDKAAEIFNANDEPIEGDLCAQDGLKFAVNDPGVPYVTEYLMWLSGGRYKYGVGSDEAKTQSGGTMSRFYQTVDFGPSGSVERVGHFDYDEAESLYQKEDFIGAVQLYEKAAIDGFAPAQGNLAIAYQDGEGVPQDSERAHFWYRKAVASGEANAQNNYGLYLIEEGDLASAASVLEMAALQGHPEAQTTLGILYNNGDGVPIDRSKSLMWLEKAASQGVEHAHHLLANMR
jgi:tetratricopeptide (TPR) repeat protein